MELRIEGLTKQFNKIIAINHVNLKLEKGVIGLLGSNGSGKTTIMKMICGILPPTSGQIYFNEQEILKNYDNYVLNLGYMPQHLGFYPNFTIQEFLEYMGIVKGLKKDFYMKKIDELLLQLNLEEKRKVKIKSLSGGMLRRVGIAQALLNEPKLLILDEPTAGLDPKERIVLRNLISRLGEKTIVLLSTHIVSDVESIADKIIVIKKGKVLYYDKPEILLKEMYGKVFEVTCDRKTAEQYMKNEIVVNVKKINQDYILRIVSDSLIRDGREVVPGLDDLYLYHFKDDVMVDLED